MLLVVVCCMWFVAVLLFVEWLIVCVERLACVALSRVVVRRLLLLLGVRCLLFVVSRLVLIVIARSFFFTGCCL